MRKLLLGFLLGCFSALSLSAQGGRPTLSIEWGGGCNGGDYHVYNYLLEGGYRVNGSQLKLFSGQLNAYVQGGLGYDFSPRLNVSLRAGYEGIGRQFRVYPAAIRATCYSQSATADGMLYYAEGGAGFATLNEIDAILARAGAGYRISLSPHTALDFLFSFRLSITNPDLFDPDSTQLIPDERIAVNQLYSNILALSVALSFR